jgi:hypothetical protein
MPRAAREPHCCPYGQRSCKSTIRRTTEGRAGETAAGIAVTAGPRVRKTRRHAPRALLQESPGRRHRRPAIHFSRRSHATSSSRCCLRRDRGTAGRKMPGWPPVRPGVRQNDSRPATVRRRGRDGDCFPDRGARRLTVARAGTRPRPSERRAAAAVSGMSNYQASATFYHSGTRRARTGALTEARPLLLLQPGAFDYSAGSGQFLEQAPGPRGSPQAPQAAMGMASAADPSPFTPAANTDSCFSRDVLLHEGHSTVVDARTSVSKWLLHPLHTYSNIGIRIYLRCCSGCAWRFDY